MGVATFLRARERHKQIFVAKEPGQEAPVPSLDTCNLCGRVCKSEAGLAAHMRAHKED